MRAQICSTHQTLITERKFVVPYVSVNPAIEAELYRDHRCLMVRFLGWKHTVA